MLKISAVLITSVTGRGEIHVNHGGLLNGFDTELRVLASEMGGSSLTLSENFWIYRDPKAEYNTLQKLCKNVEALVRLKR